MYTPKKLCLNAFVSVKCPKNKDLFERIGPRNPQGIMSHTGDAYSDPVRLNMSKMDMLLSEQRAENARLYDEYVKSEGSSTDTELSLPGNSDSEDE